MSKPEDQRPPGRVGRPAEHDRAADWQAAEEELLERVREVARRITARVRKVLDDTRTDHPTRPDDGTAETPPVV